MRRLLPFLAFAFLSTAAVAGPVVSTEFGMVEGDTSSGVHIYKGIPYAAPPTGERRWAPPAPPAAWQDTFAADDFGNACPQPERPDRARSFGTQGEDCLTLNIWAPKDARNAPVMVWIHGGAFRVGRGGTGFYSGEHFAAQGIVLVSINYRLGHLGFFAHPELTKAAGDSPVANYGIMDQVAALKWVRDNIKAFGGDPKRVTIFGESAGGSSVLYLMAVDSARPLFTQAIVQSGGGTQRARYVSKDLPGAPSQESIGLGVAKQLGVADQKDPIAALRAMTAKQIIEGANSFDIGSIGFGPVIDGKLITQPVGAAFAAGETAQVPLMIGANSYEASVLAAFQMNATTLLDRLGPAAKKARSIYANEAGDDAGYIAELAFGDVSFVAPARAVSRAHSRSNRTWQYHLDFVRERARDKVKGANHGADVVLVFNTLDGFPGSRFLFTADDRKVAKAMHQYWVNFAKTGDPNGAGLPTWPTYSLDSDPVLYIGNEVIEARSGYRKDKLDFAMQIIGGSQ